MMKTIVLGSALVVLLLSVACGGGDSNDDKVDEPTATISKDASKLTAAPQLTAEAASRPTPVPTPTALIPGPDVKVCSASDLASAYIGNSTATQMPILSFGLGNSFSVPCQLRDAPTLRFFGASGQDLAISALEADFGAGGIYHEPVLFLPGMGHFVPSEPLKAGQARITIAYSTVMCHDSSFTPPPAVVSMALVLPDGLGSVPIDRGLGACGDSVSFAYQPVRDNA